MANRITTKQLRQRIGGASDMTIWRWEHDKDLNFPKPIRIQKRRYWDEDEIEAWLRARAAK